MRCDEVRAEQSSTREVQAREVQTVFFTPQQSNNKQQTTNNKLKHFTKKIQNSECNKAKRSTFLFFYIG
jgi:hypothetical protein